MICNLWLRNASVFPQRVGGSRWRSEGQDAGPCDELKVWSLCGAFKRNLQFVSRQKDCEDCETPAAMLSSRLQLSSIQDLMCNVSHGGGTAKYNILKFVDFMDANRSKLEFSWITADKSVLANHLDHAKQVISSSCDTLVTSSCYPNVVYEGHVVLEGTVRDYTANCTTTCPAKGLFDGKGESCLTEIPSFMIGVMVILMVLVLAGLMVCLVRSRRNNGAPMMQDSALQRKVRIPADVETGNPESSV
ncbi:uncharacterized protein LOC121814531 [Haplochromis burtoni]|uniref:uncharacterized protein LOC121814531 n=1 Tax=Haplochromis burtoni TaxID=8153 RepID=UPI0003BD53D5|nr:uncharacterized protein LOC121814531 [Haplochromis burtoni]